MHTLYHCFAALFYCRNPAVATDYCACRKLACCSKVLLLGTRHVDHDCEMRSNDMNAGFNYTYCELIWIVSDNCIMSVGMWYSYQITWGPQALIFVIVGRDQGLKCLFSSRAPILIVHRPFHAWLVVCQHGLIWFSGAVIMGTAFYLWCNPLHLISLVLC